MERQYELALERIQELEEKYIDLKAQHHLALELNREYYEKLKEVVELFGSEYI